MESESKKGFLWKQLWTNQIKGKQLPNVNFLFLTMTKLPDQDVTDLFNKKDIYIVIFWPQDYMPDQDQNNIS